MPVPSTDSEEALAYREKMVNTQLMGRDIVDSDVLQVMRRIPRHLFGNFSSLREAYSDSPYAIDCQQTISQPYMVAFMTQVLDLSKNHKVLEVGTGSGYQTAILCELAHHVWSIERHPELSKQAGTVLRQQQYQNYSLVIGDGSKGHPEAAPYDRIIVTAAASAYPHALTQQVSQKEGILLFPLQNETGLQELIKVVFKPNAPPQTYNLGGVRFVPLVTGSQKEN